MRTNLDNVDTLNSSYRCSLLVSIKLMACDGDVVLGRGLKSMTTSVDCWSIREFYELVNQLVKEPVLEMEVSFFPKKLGLFMCSIFGDLIVR